MKMGEEAKHSGRLKFANGKRLLIIFLAFFIFVVILYFSYRFKFGYLKIANALFYLMVPLLILINTLKKNGKSRFFWIYILAVFLYVLADKYFRLHLKLSVYFAELAAMDPVIFVNILYVIVFVSSLFFFKKFLIYAFKNSEDWIYFLIFAVFLKIVSIFSDFEFNDITEDYFELFSLYFFSASFLIKLLDRGRNK